MSLIEHAFLEGGFGMWPTLALGTVALLLAVRHAVQPRVGLMPLVVGFGMATLFAGGLGVVTGIVTTLKHVEPLPVAQQGAIVLIGDGESLFNVVLALTLAMLTALAAGIGGWRAQALDEPALS